MNFLGCILRLVISLPLLTLAQEKDTTQEPGKRGDTIIVHTLRRVDPSIFPGSKITAKVQPPFTFDSPGKENQRPDSAWIDLFRLTLSAQFEYRKLPSYRGNVEARDVYILDSNIVRESLPELPEGKFIPISFPEIEDLAKQKGDVHFIRLAKLQIDTSTAEVVWERVSAVFSRKKDRVIYLTNRIHTATYHLTPVGWQSGSAKVEFNDYVKPE